MRRGVWWMLGLSIFFVLAPIGWMFLRQPLGVPQGFLYRYGALLIVAVPFVIIRPLWMLRTRQIRRSLAESKGRLCTNCAYNVSRLPPAGICPECGSMYDIEKDKVLWSAVEELADEEGEAKAGSSGRSP